MAPILHLADRKSPSFQKDRSSVDVVCAGDSLTGWNNVRTTAAPGSHIDPLAYWDRL
jgi:hypothetical protein